MVMITLRTDLSRIQRTNLETCITVHMHQKESTEDLMRKKVCNGHYCLGAFCFVAASAACAGVDSRRSAKTALPPSARSSG
jgi:hypothetical protein